MEILIIIAGGILYLITALFLVIINMVLFEYWTPFSIRSDIMKVQNKALGLIIRGQIFAQAILIGAVIFFTGYTPDHTFLHPEVFIPSLGYTLIFGIIGIIVLQGLTAFLFRTRSIEKEIIIDQNESLAMIIEASMVALAFLISIAFYSY